MQREQALAQGIASKVRSAIDKTLKLQPRNAERHMALGSYHTEIIAKVGGLTYGASKDKGVDHFLTAIKLNPDSAIARIENGNGLAIM